MRIDTHLWCSDCRNLLRIENRNIWFILCVKVYRRHIVKYSYRFLHRSHQNLPNCLFILKLYLCLSWMYVYIYIIRVDIKIQEIGNLFTLGNQAFISCHDSFIKIRMFHIPAIHKKELMSSFFTCSFRLPHEPRNFTHSRLNIHGQQVLVDSLAKNINDSLTSIACFHIHQFRIVTMQSKANFRINQYDSLKSSQDIIKFRGIRL